MRISDLGRYAFSCCVAVAMLAGCGGGSGTPLSPSPAGVAAQRTHVRPAYGVLYSFKGGKGDGESPMAGLINVNGTLYGTTSKGGRGCHKFNRFIHSCGTVFSITPSGTEAVLHMFGSGSGDGYYPLAGLVNVKGTLYGTTADGGAYCNHYFCGTVFSITPSGTETVLYSFKDGSRDGANPRAGLTNVKGTLYGTTAEGGASGNCVSNGCGTVFKISTLGTEGVLHKFKGTTRDGEEPLAGLVNVKGTLYGTTLYGGANCYPYQGCGTVFSITPTGKETVLYSFGGGSGDGTFPYAGVINVNGTLYGTTYNGGANCGSIGCGTVFSITMSGKETVLHSFGGAGDGAHPGAGLINLNGTLYGTTEAGGANDAGTVFAITTFGTETVLHSFGGSADGALPDAGLINVKGTLYGTTEHGGAKSAGTVFSLTP